MPVNVKCSSSVDDFKSNLENFKKKSISSIDNIEGGNFWEASREVSVGGGLYGNPRVLLVPAQ